MKRLLVVLALASTVLYGGSVRTNAGFRTASVPRNDDGSSPVQPLGFTINFFGKQRAQVYVNNNGNVTFDSALATFTPFGLERTQREIIAPYFADVDTRPPGSALVTYGQDTVNGRLAFGVNYVNVGYYNVHDDKLNSFQVVLIDRSDLGAGNFDIEFNYDRISWETGDASGGVGGFGGTPAAVGWSNGTADPGTSFQLDGSLISGAFLDNGPRSLVRNRLNNTLSGRYIFRARGGQILPPLAISSGCPLPDANLNERYSQRFTAVGGGTNLRWSAIPDPGASLPPGISMSLDGLVSGTPTTAGTTAFTVRLIAATEDGDQTVSSRCSLTVNPPVLSITSVCPLSTATVGQPYSRSLQVTGGRAPYSWALGSSGALPSGLSLNSSGLVSGAATTDGTYIFDLQVGSNPADSANPVTRSCSITVLPAVLDLTSACAIPPATTGVPYSQTLSVRGGSAPYIWTAASQLVPGLSLSSEGRISGVPSRATSTLFSAQVTDASGRMVSQTCNLTVNDPVLNITSACPLPDGTTGTSYSQRLNVTGGTAPYSWSVTGSLPAGLTMSGDGVLSGLASAAGPFGFRLLATDSTGRAVAKSCTLSVQRSSMSLSSCPISGAVAGVPFSRNIEVSGGNDPFVFALTNAAPEGLRLNSFGLISGTPARAGTYPLNILITDASGHQTTQPCIVTVSPSPLQVGGACPLPKARVGTPFVSRFTAAGGLSPYTFALVGSLPSGLTLQPDGSVSGTPLRTADDSVFNVRLTDGQGRTTVSACSITVALPDLPVIRISDIPSTLNAASAGPSISITLSQPYSLPVQGQLVITSTADTGNSEASINQADPRVRFTAGSTMVSFTILPGSRQFTAPIASTGTVAGDIVISVANLKAGGTPVVVAPAPRTFRVNRSIPVITDACYTARATGADVMITGYTTTRQLKSATFSFSPSGTGTAQTATVDLTGSSFDYFQSDDSIRNGGAFTLAAPFDITGGTIGSASLTLRNSVGSTPSRPLNRCQ